MLGFQKKSLISADNQEIKGRLLSQEDIKCVLQKVFRKHDTNNDKRLSRIEFPNVINTLIGLIGGDHPVLDDVNDLFNLIDVNGDETIDYKELKIFLNKFFDLLKQADIRVHVVKQNNQIL